MNLGTELELIIRLIIAAVLGGMIGMERESAHKPAGLRTHVFVSMGSALFTVLAIQAIAYVPNITDFNPLQMLGSILVGVGFIGGGVIMHQERDVKNITTAAGIWMSSGIGIAVGMGAYVLAITAVILSLLTLLSLQRFKSDSET
ncbi:MgtC/SapB family protein [candidate division WWE3 bacterium]|uniref:MgtC/SapB family protein n=1 Tax=candidate division WWE3 bacterium TaxID=2053526 RepID=A0A955LKX9_UNCKA|nr:MgtC/SapB family protein [candidate division WWE3 bacterium]